jgi:hypothetical protein
MFNSPSHQNSGSPCGDHPLTLEQQAAIYGFMDDHKKNMIQHWVECQAAQMKSASTTPVHRPQHHCHYQPQVLTNPSHVPLTQQQQSQQEPVPFAWLTQPMNNDNEDENGCKVLTQFKTVDSCDDSFSDSAQQQQIEQQQQKGKEYATNKRRSSQAHSHSSGSANQSVIAVDIHAQPKSCQHNRTSKVNSSPIDCSSISSPQHNSQVLPDAFSSTSTTAYTKESHLYSSIERQPKQEVKQQHQTLFEKTKKKKK